MNKVRIAYVTSDKYSPNIGYDARNFILYAKYKKIQILKFESTENYDFLILPPSLDISNIDCNLYIDFKFSNLEVLKVYDFEKF
jgi:hypothetical protein